jgi:2-dehydropantoate 2-reductase
VNKKYIKNQATFYRTQNVIDRRIHVLGMGNVGRFVAHSLRGIPNPPPVTLIFHSRDKLKEWNDSQKTLQVMTKGDTEMREGYEAELAIPRSKASVKENTSQAENQERVPLDGESMEPIHSLIVCTKTPNVIQALSSVKHRLHKESVILFLQNGLGTAEEVTKELFPDRETRPHYMLGINSHGMHGTRDDPFTTVHAGFGTISLGILPHERDREPAPYLPVDKFSPYSNGKPIEQTHPVDPDPQTPQPTPPSVRWTPNHRYLLRTLLRMPVLGATAFSPPDLLQLQLEKLAVNCIINPLTVLLDARNGAVLYDYSHTRVMRLLLSEISLVIRSLPELQYIPNVQQRFDPGRLETLVVGIANKTKDNISSMLADVRAGRQTEIDYINGWIVKRGEELGLRCALNYMLMHQVKGKARMISKEKEDVTPLVMPWAEDKAL